MSILATIFGFVTSKVGRIAAIIGAAFAALGFAYLRGRSSAKADQERKNLEEYKDVRKNVDEAVRRSDGDTRPVDERLREHGALRD